MSGSYELFLSLSFSDKTVHVYLFPRGCTTWATFQLIQLNLAILMQGGQTRNITKAAGKIIILCNIFVPVV